MDEDARRFLYSVPSVSYTHLDVYKRQEYAMLNGRKYKTKQASAQEAHEAIRPTYMEKTPESIGLDPQEAKLYRLIWELSLIHI